MTLNEMEKRRLLQTLQDDPAFLAQVRSLILPAELLELPERFAEFVRLVTAFMEQQKEFNARVADQLQTLTNDVAVLKDDVAVLKDDMAVLKDDMAGVKGDVAVLKSDMVGVKQQLTTMSGQIANLTGNDYETRAIEGSRRLIRRALGMEQAIILHASKRESPTEFETEFLVPAIRAGRITRQQADELEEADSIIRCENPDGELVCAVVEISVTVQDHDRSRAAERAEIFSLATGLRTLAYTVGQDQEEPGSGIPDVPFLKY